MSRRRILKSALYNFLGTFTSRYTEFDGYWLFGFLVPQMTSIEVDLLGADPSDSDPAGTAATLAIKKFSEQLEKARIDIHQLRSAKLAITHPPSTVRKAVWGFAQFALGMQTMERDGYDLTFTAEAVIDDGLVFSVNRTVLVAPHDPTKECRSYQGLPPD